VSHVTPARIGVLIDYLNSGASYDENSSAAHR
jgi:hypothetical protein